MGVLGEGEEGRVDFRTFHDFFYRLGSASFDALDQDGSGELEKGEAKQVALAFGVGYRP